MYRTRRSALSAQARAGRSAQRMLRAEAAVLGAAALVLLVRELPGIRREVRIWRMINLRSGAKRPA
ncbi:hypothetical protein [Streptomyces sp. NPDC007205]|uniref:hypothetical protein n=1 Tax=Streptomyces sp. NPDC007205 TaxID=3154316 RepID=UPI0033D5BE43